MSDEKRKFETNTHVLQDAVLVKRQARSLGIEVTGSELVGLAPLQAIVKAGEFYAAGKSRSEQELVAIAVEKLGLDQLEPFDSKKKIIEYQIDSF